jgi:hypothetical protein
MGNDEQPSKPGEPEGEVSLFVHGVIWITKGYSQWVPENRSRLKESDAVFPFIRCGLIRVPFKYHYNRFLFFILIIGLGTHLPAKLNLAGIFIPKYNLGTRQKGCRVRLTHQIMARKTAYGSFSCFSQEWCARRTLHCQPQMNAD